MALAVTLTVLCMLAGITAISPSEDLAAITYFITSHVGVISVLLRTVFTSLLPTSSFSSWHHLKNTGTLLGANYSQEQINLFPVTSESLQHTWKPCFFRLLYVALDEVWRSGESFRMYALLTNLGCLVWTQQERSQRRMDGTWTELTPFLRTDLFYINIHVSYGIMWYCFMLLDTEQFPHSLKMYSAFPWNL